MPTKTTPRTSKKPANAARTNSGASTIHRFAHPFFAATPAGASQAVPADAKAITSFSATQLQPIPKPKRTPQTMTLADIVGVKGSEEIAKNGTIVFHACGDSGNPKTDMQEVIAEAMSKDYNTKHPERSPAFFLHLGDVIYYDNTDSGYHEQFYAPYKKYPGKIIAIPGNHDGELFKFDGSSTGQKVTLGAFQDNFCQPKPGIPKAAGTIYRQMVNQPGVYWQLDAPFVDIISLYSNIGETPGFISGKQIGQVQKDWLVKTLTAIAKARTATNRKALILAVHHPPYSNGGHEPSITMLADLDDAFKKAGIMPDVVLAAHAHNYQRYIRSVSFGGKKRQIPYLVAGTGGRGIQSVTKATGQVQGEVTYGKSLPGYGFLRVSVSKAAGTSASAGTILLEFTQVQENPDHTPKMTPLDTVKVNLANATVTTK